MVQPSPLGAATAWQDPPTLLFARRIRELRLSAEDLRVERGAPDGALELLRQAKTAVRVAPRGAEGLPMGDVSGERPVCLHG